VIGAAVLSISHQNPTLLPPSEWGLGPDTSASIWSGRYRDAGVDGYEHYRLGFFQVRVAFGNH
jgi:hypothetical protein